MQGVLAFINNIFLLQVGTNEGQLVHDVSQQDPESWGFYKARGRFDLCMVRTNLQEAMSELSTALCGQKRAV